jgi:hypothetical protein
MLIGQLRAGAFLLVGGFLAVMGFLVARGNRQAIRLWSLRDRESQEFFSRGTPAVFGGSLALTTALLIVLLATEHLAGDWIAYAVLDVLPLLLLGVLTLGLVVKSLGLRTEPEKAFAWFSERYAVATSAAYVGAIIVFALPAVRYIIAGVQGILSAPPDILSLGELLAGGSALIVFEFWLGQLFANRNLIRIRANRLERFHADVARGELTPEKASQEYASIVAASVPPSPLVQALTGKSDID